MLLLAGGLLRHQQDRAVRDWLELRLALGFLLLREQRDGQITGIVTNGVNPEYITQTSLLTDGCGNSNTCSQTVTVLCKGKCVIDFPFVINGAFIVNCETFDPNDWQVECSTDLVHWTILTSQTNSPPPIVINTQTNTAPQQFYRFINTNGP